MSLAHAAVLYTHIATASLGLLSGAAAMVLRKGSPSHARAGRVFFVSMTAMTIAALILASSFAFSRLNLSASVLTLYLVLTAWRTARQRPGTTGRADRGLLGLGIIGLLLVVAFMARAAGIPAARAVIPVYLPFAALLVLGVTGDVRMLRGGGVTGATRTTRHLWRMVTAMLIATMSFFIGQADEFPATVRESGLLTIPVVLVALALLYWLVKFGLLPRLRGAAVTPASPAT